MTCCVFVSFLSYMVTLVRRLCATRLLAFLQGDFSLTYFQDGLLPAAFMVGLLLSSPVFAEASKTRNPFRCGEEA